MANSTYTQGLRTLLRRIQHAAPALMTGIAQEVLPEAQGQAPVQSGRLRDSIHVEPTDTGAALVADAPYAAQVHDDLQTPHETGKSRFLTDPTEALGPDALRKRGTGAL